MQFYQLRVEKTRGIMTFRFGDDGYKIINNVLLGNLDNVKLPVELYYEKGQKWEDVLNDCSISILIVSKKFIDLLIENGITGWKSYPVLLRGKKNIVYDEHQYYGLSITGRSGDTYVKKSTLFEKKDEEYKDKYGYFKGDFFDEETWDGSDIFIPENTSKLFISEKFYQLLKKQNYKVLELTPLEEVELSGSLYYAPSGKHNRHKVRDL